MKIQINGRELEGSIAVRMADDLMNGRESRAVTVTMSYGEALNLFQNDVSWAVVNEWTDEDGTPRSSITDLSEFCISGPITDHRDGRVTIRMGKPRAEELMLVPLGEAPKTKQEADTLRGVLEAAVQSIQSDEDALVAKSIYPTWEELDGTWAEPGLRFQHQGYLYKVISAHTIGPNWVPGQGTESLYVRIDETHAGTMADPIPYEGNMALVAGLYYSQNGVTYRCTRDTGNPVYSDLRDLVGLYVEVV